VVTSTAGVRDSGIAVAFSVSSGCGSGISDKEISASALGASGVVEVGSFEGGRIVGVTLGRFFVTEGLGRKTNSLSIGLSSNIRLRSTPIVRESVQ
jgi:hypothetical protein